MAKSENFSLFGEELPEEWELHWVGMPEYSHEDLKPVKQLIISFATDCEVEKFSKLIGQKITTKTQSIWFVAQEIGKYTGVSYESE